MAAATCTSKIIQMINSVILFQIPYMIAEIGFLPAAPPDRVILNSVIEPQWERSGHSAFHLPF